MASNLLSKLATITTATLVLLRCTADTFLNFSDSGADSASVDASPPDDAHPQDDHSNWQHDAGPPDTSSTEASASSKRVFLTSKTYAATFGGATQADAICNAIASGDAGLGGTWIAWVSSSSSNAGSRLTHSLGSYVLLDGTIIAYNWSDLISGKIEHRIDRNEFNDKITGQPINVWTGTTPTGTATDGGTTCQDWTSESLTSFGYVGVTNQSDNRWTDDQTVACGPSGIVTASLYCFER